MKYLKIVLFILFAGVLVYLTYKFSLTLAMHYGIENKIMPSWTSMLGELRGDWYIFRFLICLEIVITYCSWCFLKGGANDAEDEP